tara:strand:+ start:14961 stop:16109 length:1149 start_codon:yes stop_codon:yes gene_type:complete
MKSNPIKDRLIIYDFQFCYDAVIGNKKAALDLHNVKDDSFKFFISSVFYCLSIVAKIFISNLLAKKNNLRHLERIGVNWSRFSKRLTSFDSSMPIFDYYFSKFDKSQVLLFKDVSLLDVLKLSFSTSSVKLENNGNNRDNFFYKFVCSAEFIMYKKLCEQIDPKQIVVAGLNDRHTFFLSEICKKNRIYFTLVQHGTLFKIDNFKLCEVNEFAYCFDFSLPFLKYYLKNIEGINIKFIPNESKSIEVVEYEKGNDNIAFACMPTNVALNFKVINALSEILNKNFNLIIYPHPREDFDSYLKAYNKNEKIIVSRAKYSNVKLVVSRVSTIGVDFANIGLPVIYVNFEQSETDYLATGKYAVVYEIETLNKFMLENYSPYLKIL